MTAKILNGKEIAETIRAEVAREVKIFHEATGKIPCLTAILVGDDPASAVYVRNKEIACAKVGMQSKLIRLPATTTTNELVMLVESLSADAEIHGILVQLPLPKTCDEQQVLDAMSSEKDVDAFHPYSVGLIAQGRPRFLPCTPAGIQQLLIRSQIETRGKHVVIVGRSDIVGKPMGLMLLAKSPFADATVTTVHSRTTNLPRFTREADILIVAIGKAKFVTAEMVQPGAVVIDVGINRLADGTLCGDVDFAQVAPIASAITPVPGGVGPLTIAMLMRNTFTAAQAQ